MAGKSSIIRARSCEISINFIGTQLLPLLLEYHPQPPFNAGMPEMTGDEAVQCTCRWQGNGPLTILKIDELGCVKSLCSKISGIIE
jgi:hypothetical protein